MKFLPIVFFCAAVLCTKSVSASNDPSVRLRGGMDFSTGYYKNWEKLSANKLSAHQKHFAFNSTTYFYADANNITDSGFQYGAQIGMQTSSRNTRKASSFLYTISDAGKIELGSNKSVMNSMKITGYSNACGTADLWDIWMKSDPANKGGIYITNFGNFLDAKTRSMGHEEYSRKITYYTPELKNFQFGISYIPDTSNVGYSTINANIQHNPTRMPHSSANIKDGIAIGLTYNYKLDDTTKLRTSIVAEKGKAVGALHNNTPIKLKNLKSYTAGAEITYKQFSVAGAYSNYIKSLTNPTINTLGCNTDLYGLTVRYIYENNVGSSISHFVSNHQQSQIHATTLSFDYRKIKGLLPYAATTYYETDGYYLDKITSLKTKDNHKGVVCVVGVKVEF